MMITASLDQTKMKQITETYFSGYLSAKRALTCTRKKKSPLKTAVLLIFPYLQMIKMRINNHKSATHEDSPLESQDLHLKVRLSHS